MICVLAIAALCATPLLGSAMRWIVLPAAGFVMLVTAASLGVSHYIYDRSGLYQLPWTDGIGAGPGSVVVNINAGFDR